MHLYYLDDAKFMLRTKADIIAHSVRDLPVDPEFIDMMTASDTCYIPTLTRELSTYVYESVPDFFEDLKFGVGHFRRFSLGQSHHHLYRT